MSAFISSYNGNSGTIIFFKKFNENFNHNHHDYYYSSERYSIEAERKKDRKIIISLIILIILSSSLLYLPSILSSSSPRLYDIYAIPGNIKTQVEEEYSMDRIIYFPVKVGGLDNGLSITLSKFDSGKFEEISSLVLYSNQTITQKNYSLSGRTNNNGNYDIYLDPKSDPKSISEGNYQLTFNNAQNKKMSSSKVFFLSSK